MKVNSPNIIYHGEIRDTAKIKAILSQSDVLVCASWSEGFPNVILEGMACGLAIIATNVGAISAMVSDKNGWLIEPANTDVLHKTMLEVINYPDLSLKKETSLQLVNIAFNWGMIYEKTIVAIKL
jgi:glycosyltransferase involved in cell wall biosynthesis